MTLKDLKLKRRKDYDVYYKNQIIGSLHLDLFNFGWTAIAYFHGDEYKVGEGFRLKRDAVKNIHGFHARMAIWQNSLAKGGINGNS